MENSFQFGTNQRRHQMCKSFSFPLKLKIVFHNIVSDVAHNNREPECEPGVAAVLSQDSDRDEDRPVTGDCTIWPGQAQAPPVTGLVSAQLGQCSLLPVRDQLQPRVVSDSVTTSDCWGPSSCPESSPTLPHLGKCEG